MKHPTLPIEKKVAVVGCKHTTLELIDGLRRAGLNPDRLITISPEQGAKHDVAGYEDLVEPARARGLDVYSAKYYSLKSDEDREALLPMGLDLLLVMGWQRLIPDWFLESLNIGAFGMHGSSKHLPWGRGRSPMNWSLIQNKTAFFTHLFRYKPGVDDGDVVGYQAFDITEHDTALTLHYKNTVSMIKLAGAMVPRLMEGGVSFESQREEGATYYPKRSPEDGLIFWEDATLDVYNLIRAVTRPFAGAFTFLDDDPGARITIWRAIPFDGQIRYDDAAPGEIVEVFAEGHFVVKTGTTTLLVLESEGVLPSGADIGRRLGTAGSARKLFTEFPI